MVETAAVIDVSHKPRDTMALPTHLLPGFVDLVVRRKHFKGAFKYTPYPPVDFCYKQREFVELAKPYQIGSGPIKHLVITGVGLPGGVTKPYGARIAAATSGAVQGISLFGHTGSYPDLQGFSGGKIKDDIRVAVTATGTRPDELTVHLSSTAATALLSLLLAEPQLKFKRIILMNPFFGLPRRRRLARTFIDGLVRAYQQTPYDSCWQYWHDSYHDPQAMKPGEAPRFPVIKWMPFRALLEVVILGEETRIALEAASRSCKLSTPTLYIAGGRDKISGHRRPLQCLIGMGAERHIVHGMPHNPLVGPGWLERLADIAIAQRA